MPHGEGVVEAEARCESQGRSRVRPSELHNSPLSLVLKTVNGRSYNRSRRLLPLCSSPPCGRGSAALAGPTNMGKIIRGPEAWSQVKLSTRRVGGGGACSEEFAAYLTCLDKTQANEEECKTLREALRRCMYVASSGARTSRHVVPINYHLQKVRRRIA